MFVEAGNQHHRPHFHAYYQEHAAVFSIDTVEAFGGGLPAPQRRLVEARAEIHHAELQHDWELLQSGRPPSRLTHSGNVMVHPIHRVTRFEIVGPYTLAVGFEDGTDQVIDFELVLRGELFGALRDRSVFDAVVLDSEAGTLVWPNGADFDPATLHDWPQVRDELTRRASSWGTSTQRPAKTMEPTRR